MARTKSYRRFIYLGPACTLLMSCADGSITGDRLGYAQDQANASDAGWYESAPSSLGLQQTPLVSDDETAPVRDPNLVNAWGLAIDPSTSGAASFWIAANRTGVSTVYDANGTIVPTVVDLTSGGKTTATPTGVVYNATRSFLGDRFIFADEDGTIKGWTSGATGVTRADQSASKASYKGLAIVGDTLWAANFRAGTIDVFDANYELTTIAPSDPELPAGYAPFNVVDIEGKVYVSYALQDDDAKDDVAGAGHGYIDVFGEDGQLEQRLVSAGALNSPWGLARAPANYGVFSNALLVGNFGDGAIHAYDTSTGALLGSVTDPSGTPLTISGLWALQFGPDGARDLMTTLFYTAGPGGEEHGVFGKLELPRPTASP